MIHVIGIGVEGRESLTPRALGLVTGAGLLVGGKRHLNEFPESTAQRVEVKGGLDRAASAIEEFIAGGGRNVAVLATGDPLFFGIAGFIIKRFGKRNVGVIPNVSTVAEAFARIKESWAGAKTVSAHGRESGLSAVCAEAASNDRLAVFTDPVNTPALIARSLMERGVSGFKAYVCEALGMKEERVTGGSLKQIAARKRFHPLNVMILIREPQPAPASHRTGVPDEAFRHSEGMITKEEIRVISLSKLSIERGAVVWDIGAGCGSVSVEAALMARPGRVWAVEKEAGRVKDIRANKEKFKAGNLEIISGLAPGCMRDKKLPAPDAVFVGGGGAGLLEILRFVARRVKKGGRVVVNAVTLESAYGAFEFFRKKGWERELSVVNLSKARSLGELNLLKANNPVFIIRGTKV